MASSDSSAATKPAPPSDLTGPRVGPAQYPPDLPEASAPPGADGGGKAVVSPTAGGSDNRPTAPATPDPRAVYDERGVVARVEQLTPLYTNHRSPRPPALLSYVTYLA